MYCAAFASALLTNFPRQLCLQLHAKAYAFAYPKGAFAHTIAQGKTGSNRGSFETAFLLTTTGGKDSQFHLALKGVYRSIPLRPIYGRAIIQSAVTVNNYSLASGPPNDHYQPTIQPCGIPGWRTNDCLLSLTPVCENKKHDSLYLNACGKTSTRNHVLGRKSFFVF